MLVHKQERLGGFGLWRRDEVHRVDDANRDADMFGRKTIKRAERERKRIVRAESESGELAW